MGCCPLQVVPASTSTMFIIPEDVLENREEWGDPTEQLSAALSSLRCTLLRSYSKDISQQATFLCHQQTAFCQRTVEAAFVFKNSTLV